MADLPTVDTVGALDDSALRHLVMLGALAQVELLRRALPCSTPAKEPQRTISVSAAAERSGLSRDYFWDNAEALGFGKRVGRRLLVLERPFERWLTSRA